ncbi:MAG: DUF3084 domain-containing protein [Cyanobacteria bacterium REEB459]|nr:DUF3084 domain-containing protein [Cyanobacteria bacterium REEB459]
MVSGYVLILAVLLLGGGIATLGDRIGMRVGKARLSLFNLRPRQTATLVSIATGSIISASTLGILFGISSQLRTGVFELGKIQNDLTSAQTQLSKALAAQERVKADLAAAATERQRALSRLGKINQSLNRARDQQARTQMQLRQTRQQLVGVSQEAISLRHATDFLRTQRDRLKQQQAAISAKIARRDQSIKALDQVIADRDREILDRERRLRELESQQALLEERVAELQSQYEGLFRGNIALGRNQVLLSGLVQVDNRQQARDIIDRFLYEANRRAIQAIAPGRSSDQQVILISRQEVQRLVDRLANGQEYIVRLLSAANYVTGEACVIKGGDPCIQVFVDATANQQVYSQGQRLATVNLDRLPLSDRSLVESLNLLLASAQFRARQDGIVDDKLEIGDNRTDTLLKFLSAVKQANRTLELQVVTATNIYTAGPLQINILALDQGTVLLNTNDFGQGPGGR